MNHHTHQHDYGPHPDRGHNNHQADPVPGLIEAFLRRLHVATDRRDREILTDLAYAFAASLDPTSVLDRAGRQAPPPVSGSDIGDQPTLSGAPSCRCCGFDHGQALAPGEHCDFCDRPWAARHSLRGAQ